MTPLRETFWNIPKWAELSQYVLGVVAMLVFVYGVYRRVRRWRLGRPEVLTGTLKGRVWAFILYALAPGRRSILRAPRLKSETLPTFVWDDAYLLGMLLVIVISGFLIEGVRIAALDPPWSGWGPGGARAGRLSPPPLPP